MNKLVIAIILVNFSFLVISSPNDFFEEKRLEKTFQIYANTAHYSLDKKIINFEGNVSANDGEFFIHANKLTVLLNDRNKVININAYEKVTLKSKKIDAHCNSLLYDTKKELLILMGNAKLEYTLKDKSKLKSVGEKIIYNIKLGLIEN